MLVVPPGFAWYNRPKVGGTFGCGPPRYEYRTTKSRNCDKFCKSHTHRSHETPSQCNDTPLAGVKPYSVGWIAPVERPALVGRPATVWRTAGSSLPCYQRRRWACGRLVAAVGHVAAKALDAHLAAWNGGRPRTLVLVRAATAPNPASQLALFPGDHSRLASHHSNMRLASRNEDFLLERAFEKVTLNYRANATPWRSSVAKERDK